MRTTILTSAFICALAMTGSDFVVIDKDRMTVVTTGNATLLSEKMDSIGTANINKEGMLRLSSDICLAAEITAEGFEPRFLRLQDMTSDTIFLRPIRDLEEVVVTPDNVKEYGNHTSYRIPMADMKRYNNFYLALNEIPHLTVLPSGNAYFEGNPDIKFLLNGVDSNIAELKTISKGDILNVDVYKNPSARFAAQGYTTVIDVRTKSGLRGGNVGVEIDQSFYPLYGDNSAAFYYNYRQSRFSLIYSNENRHYNKNRDHERLRYEFEGVSYEKSKRGLDSKFDLDNNNLTFSYQNNKPKDYLYNLQAGVSVNRKRDNMRQIVTSNTNEFEAMNKLYTSYNRFNIANYFEKGFGADASKGNLIANINVQHYDTKYRSSYQEFPTQPQITPVDVRSAYKTRIEGVFTDVQYELPPNNAGYFSIDLFDSFKQSRYVDSYTPFRETINSYGANAVWLGSWRNIQWYAKIGMQVLYTSTTLMDKANNVITPTPFIRFIWRPSQRFQFRASYSYSAEPPSIAQLSETDRWLDTRLVYHGNARLKTYKSHALMITGVMGSKYVDLSTLLHYNSSPGMICSMYQLTDKYMLETIVNLDRYKSFTGELTVTLKPLGNNKLKLRTHLIGGDLRGKNQDYKWHGSRFQWMSSISLNLDKWSAWASYQYPGKITNGQLIRPRPECWSLSGSYRPIPDLSIGLSIFMPFGNTYGDSEYTVKDSPVYYKISSDMPEIANRVSLQISWNMSFGRKKNYARPKFSHPDYDSGLLEK